MKLRVLCLHGYQQNENELRRRMMLLQESTDNFVEYGYVSLAPVHDGYMERLGCKLPFPSLHVIGEADHIVTASSSKELSTWFQRRAVLMMEHDGGHIIPQKEVYRKDFIDFLKKYHGQDPSATIFPGVADAAEEDVDSMDAIPMDEDANADPDDILDDVPEFPQ
ncbi:hypothetical protein HK101_002834 [Irineochytrium annulatum]|nr:hypothetical protein HK101_002834 [Irineochytrium annulatum]